MINFTIVTVDRVFQDDVAPDITTSLMSAAQLKEVEWSAESLILVSSKGMTIYHNYTMAIEDGHQRTRWTKRQFIPSPAESTLQHRYMAEMWADGDANRPTNIWPTKIRGRPVIPYCYENQDAKTKFSSILEEAINRWHTALGDNAGIKFVPNCEHICDNIVDNRPPQYPRPGRHGGQHTLLWDRIRWLRDRR
jgi:hypothetical protein